MALTKKEIAYFKSRLEELKNQISKQLQGSSEEVKKPDESSGYSQHQADQGTDNFDRTISLEVTNQEYEVLKQIERALEKIEDETYGVCDLSEEEIPKPRLEAIPYATMTVKAQEQFEKGMI
jgi:RNA polymerase-binding transcription factor